MERKMDSREPVPVPRNRSQTRIQDTKNNNGEEPKITRLKPVPLPRKLLQRLGSSGEKKKSVKISHKLDAENENSPSPSPVSLEEIPSDEAKRGTINIFKRGRAIDPFEEFEKDFETGQLLRAVSFGSPLQELSDEAKARLSSLSSSSSLNHSNSDSSDYYDQPVSKVQSELPPTNAVPKKPERRFCPKSSVPQIGRTNPFNTGAESVTYETVAPLPTSKPIPPIYSAINKQKVQPLAQNTSLSSSVPSLETGDIPTSEIRLDATYSRVKDELSSLSNSSSRTTSLPCIEDSAFQRNDRHRASEGSNPSACFHKNPNEYDDVAVEDGTVVFLDNQLNTRTKTVCKDDPIMNPRNSIVMEFDPLFDPETKNTNLENGATARDTTQTQIIRADCLPEQNVYQSINLDGEDVNRGSKSRNGNDPLSLPTVDCSSFTEFSPKDLPNNYQEIPQPRPPVTESCDGGHSTEVAAAQPCENELEAVEAIEEDVLSNTGMGNGNLRRLEGGGSFLRRLSHKIRLIPIREESIASRKSSAENLNTIPRCEKCQTEHIDGIKCKFIPQPRQDVVYSSHLYRPTGLVQKEFTKRWTVLSNGKLCFYNDKRVLLEEVHLDRSILIKKKNDHRLGMNSGIVLKPFEISFPNGKNMLVLAGISEGERASWMQKCVEAFVSVFPSYVISSYDQAGWCFIKESVTSEWHPSWLILKQRTLCQAFAGGNEFHELDLRKARSVSLSTKDVEQRCPFVENSEFLTVDMITKILFIQTEAVKMTTSWGKVIGEAARQNGTEFHEMQLTLDDVPVIVDKCIDFLYAHGTLAEGIYRQSGSNARITQLLADFQRDSWAVQISHKEFSAHDVAGTLKRFFRTLPEPLFTTRLYNSWIAASKRVDGEGKLNFYEELLVSLPTINRNILKKLICHLYAVHELHEKNLMPVNNLAPIWGPTLMNVESPVKVSHTTTESNEHYRNACAESEVVKDLISNYYTLFRVDSDAREREKKMQDALENFHLGATKRKCSGDMKMWIYIWEKDESTAINITLTPQGTAHNIVQQLCRSVQLRTFDDNLSLHEVICQKSLERPLHPSEIVIETVLRWSIWDIDERKDNYLILKKNTLYPALIPFAKDPTAVYGDFKFADSKSKSLKKYAFKFGRAILKYYKDSKAVTELGSWKIEDIVWYMGTEPKRSPPPRWAFTFVKRNYPFKRSREEPYFGNVVSCSSEEELHKWIAAMGGAPGAPSYYPTAVAMYSTDKVMNGKPLGSSISASGSCFPGRYSPTYRGPDPMRSRCVNSTGDLFGGLNDGLLSREALVDISKHPGASPPVSGLNQLKHDMMYHPSMGPPHPSHNSRPHQVPTTSSPNSNDSPPMQISSMIRAEHPRSARDYLLFSPQMGHPGMDGLEMLDSISSTTMMTSLGGMGGEGVSVSHAHAHAQLHPSSMYTHSMNSMMVAASHPSLPHPHSHPHSGHPHPSVGIHDTDTDPRELEAFAERFKQRRIKLGVTQADVGKALANLKLPGVGALSQSTICRFESLTLSHNNMIALKPILQAWLEEAEAQARSKRRDPDAPNVLPAGEKKRKRTSIAAPEKRSLEAFFAVQPRPSGEKIAAMAEKLDLKKNVVRVWFCNQRQKQKRMKFAAQH